MERLSVHRIPTAKTAVIGALLFTAAFLFAAPSSHAATYWWVGGTNTTFERAANWSAIPRGAAGAVAPGAGDVAVFSHSGGNILIRSNVRLGGLLLANNWTGSILVGTGTLRVVDASLGGIRVGSGRLLGTTSSTGAISSAAGFTQSGGIVTAKGTMTLSGALTLVSVSGRTVAFTQTGTIVVDGTSTQNYTIGSNRVTANITNLTLQKSSSLLYVNGSGMTLLGSLTVTTGTLDLRKTSPAQALSVRYNTTLEDDSSAALLSGNAASFSGSLTVGASATFTQTGATTFNGLFTQTITLNNTSPTFGGDVTVNNTAAQNTRNLITFAGNAFRITGTTTVTQGTFDTNTNSIASTHNGNVTVADNALARFLSNANVSFAGNIIVKPAATFTHTAGNVTPILGGGTQTLSGTITLATFAVGGGTGTLQVYPGYTWTVSALSVAGSSTKYTMKSAIDASRWTITTSGKNTISAVALKDSNSTYVYNICLDCTDNGNNYNWSFESTPTSNSSGTSGGSSGGGGGGGGGGGRLGGNIPFEAPSDIGSKSAAPESGGIGASQSKIQKRITSLEKALARAKNDKVKKRLEKAIKLLSKRK